MPAMIYYILEDEVVQILSYGLRSKEISQFEHVSAAIVIQIITNSTSISGEGYALSKFLSFIMPLNLTITL